MHKNLRVANNLAHRKWYASLSPEARKEHNKKRGVRYREQQNRYREANKDRDYPVRREGNLKRLYGITLKEYTELYTRQEGLCKICNLREISKRGLLSVDHCHVTGKIRGLLCRKCNTALGLANDSVVILNTMIKYLEENK